MYTGNGEDIPFGVYDIVHPRFGVVKTAVMGNGQVGIANIETTNGVTIGLFDTDQEIFPIGQISEEVSAARGEVKHVDIMLTFANIESVDVVISALNDIKDRLNAVGVSSNG